MIATNRPLGDVLEALVLGMEANHSHMRGSILLVAEDGEHLKTAAAPNLPADYQRLVEQLTTVGPNSGSCGTACYRGARVVAEDVATDPSWTRYREQARAASVGACWSEPIFSRTGAVLGSFAMYYSEPRAPGPAELESIAIAARLAAVAVDRARADEALRRNEERLQLALSAAKMGTWDWDVESDRVVWSSGVAPLFGLPASDFNQRFADYLGLISEEDQGRVRAAIDLVLWGEANDYAIEHRVLWADGALHWLECKGRVYRSADGMPTRMAGTVADISERKLTEFSLRQSEEQLRQAQKMEAIGRLAGGVAHDFNNLLTAIGGYSSLALLDFPVDDPRREYLEEIQRAGERGAYLTKQLLASGRKQVLSPRLIDINALLDGLASLLRRVIGEDVELEWTRGSAPAVVFADPGQIEQIMMNLAVNARDAMPQGGTLTLSSTHVELHAGDSRGAAGPHISLRVTDTGHGMDEATMQRMFEPFFTTKDPGQGTGLGLSTVYGIVQQLSGSIRARSVLGVGTEFEIYLPERERGLPSARPESVAPAVRGGDETVLLVEDEAQVRRLVHEVLQARGYQVLAATDAREAIALEEKYPARIDLLITDLIMPGMSGRELAQHVTATRPEAKVLFISGYTDDALLRHGVTVPGTSFLQKPFALEDLLLRVRALLDSGRVTASPTEL